MTAPQEPVRLDYVIVQRNGTVRERFGQKRKIGEVHRRGAFWVTKPPIPYRCQIRAQAVESLVRGFNGSGSR